MNQKGEKWVKEEDGVYWPTEKMKRKAFISDPEIYREAGENPVEFWAEKARNLIDWFDPDWEETEEWDPPYFKWFKGGTTNLCYNCIDRHLEDKGDDPALIWEPESVEENKRVLTYQDLHQEVQKFGNVLKKLGVEKGDPVTFWMPMVPETAIAALACQRIGAKHSIVYTAFSPHAVKDRMQDAESEILITADGMYRRGDVIKLKDQLDEVLAEVDPKSCVVVNRADSDPKMESGRDQFWSDLMDDVEASCKPEKLDAEDTSFLLYTSGCCHPDTMVQLGSGEVKRISDLVKEGGSEVVNAKVEELEMRKEPIEKKHEYNWDTPLYRIKTAFGEGLFTPNHPFYVLTRDARIREKEAREIKKRDHVLTATRIDVNGKKQEMPPLNFKYERKGYPNPKNKPSFPKFLTPGVSQIFGYMAGDGSVRKQAIELTDKDRQNLCFYKKLFEEELKLRCSVKKYDRQRLIINSTSIASYIKEAFPEIIARSQERTVPPLVQRSENETVAAFIRGLFDAEGTISGDSLKIVSTSPALIRTTQLLLLRFGIISSRREFNTKTEVNGKKYEPEVFVLRLTDRPSLRKFKEAIGFSSKKKQARFEALLGELEGKKEASMINLVPINDLLKTLRNTIKLPDEEAHEIFLDSYLYSSRRIRADRLPIIIDYIEEKIGTLKDLDLSKRADLKTAISLLKIKEGELAQTSGKSENAVHKYIYAKEKGVSKEAINKFHNEIRPYISSEREEGIDILKKLVGRLKKINNAKGMSFFEVKDVEVTEGQGKVYDLSTSENHNYIANGFIGHNTTGRPKGIRHSVGGYQVQAALTMKWVFDFHPDDLFFSTADIGWITGHSYTLYGPLLLGGTTLWYEGAPDYPEADRWWKIIEKNGPAQFYTAPTALRMLRKKGEDLPEKHDLSSLRILGSVGEPIDPNTWEWYFEEVGGGRCPIVDTYWQTETGGILLTSLPGIGPFLPGVAGVPFPSVSYDVVDHEGEPVEEGQKGAVVQKHPFPPGMLRGVYKNPEKYREEYWSRSGDKVYFSGDGGLKTQHEIDGETLIKITGRMDDVLEVAGHRLGTAEIEDAAQQMDEVVEAAAVGKPHEIKSEVPAIFVILGEGVKETEEIKKRIVKAVREKVGPVATPGAIYFVQELPETESGKIMRRFLKSLLRGGKLGDMTTAKNPECLKELAEVVGYEGPEEIPGYKS